MIIAGGAAETRSFGFSGATVEQIRNKLQQQSQTFMPERKVTPAKPPLNPQHPKSWKVQPSTPRECHGSLRGKSNRTDVHPDLRRLARHFPSHFAKNKDLSSWSGLRTGSSPVESLKKRLLPFSCWRNQLPTSMKSNSFCSRLGLTALPVGQTTMPGSLPDRSPRDGAAGAGRQSIRMGQSPDRWHRRAACVALIHGTRRRQFFPKIRQLSNMLLKMKMTWCRKASAGYFAKLRRQTQSEPFLICS